MAQVDAQDAAARRLPVGPHVELVPDDGAAEERVEVPDHRGDRAVGDRVLHPQLAALGRRAEEDREQEPAALLGERHVHDLVGPVALAEQQAVLRAIGAEGVDVDP